MLKLVKFIAWLVGIVVVLAVVAAVAIPLFFDPNDFKPQIAEQVKKHTGRDLNIEGDIALSLFPWLGLDIGRLTLANPEGFEQADFAAIDSAKVRVKLMPLLKRELQADTVTIDGLRLNLERKATSETNWQDLAALAGDEDVEAAAQAAAEAQQAETEQESDGAVDLPLEDIAIGGLLVNDASILWNDAAGGQRIEINGLQAETSEIRLGQPFSIALKGAVKTPDLAADIDFGGNVDLDLPGQVYRVGGLTLNATVSGGAVPGGNQPVALAGDVVFDGGAQTLSVDGLSLRALGLEASGAVNGDNLPLLPNFTGNLALKAFNPSELMGKLGQTPPATADANVLQTASGSLSFNATPLGAKADNISMQLDQTSLSGSLDAPLKGTIKFDLVVDAIDLDRYLPPRASNEAPAVETPGSATGKAAAKGELPLQPLRELDLAGKLKVGKLKVNQLRMNDVSLPIAANGGKLQLSPLAAKLYGGSYQGNIGLDVTADQPAISVNETLSAVQAGPLLVDLIGEERVSGSANASIKLTMRGADAASIKQSLNGTAQFTFGEGAVKGINIGKLIRQAKSQLQGQASESAAEAEQTDFSELSASVTFADGVASNQDLSAKSPLLRVTGEGNANLVQEQVDYGLVVALVDTSKGQGGKELEELRGIPIPIKITGDLNDPSFGLDLAAILEQQTKQALEKETEKVVEKAKEQLQEKIGEELGDKLGEQLGEQLGDQAGDALKGGAESLLKGLLGD